MWFSLNQSKQQHSILWMCFQLSWVFWRIRIHPGSARVSVGTTALLDLASFLLPSSHQHSSRARFCLLDKPVFSWTILIETNVTLFYPVKAYLHWSYLLSLKTLYGLRFCFSYFFFQFPNICLLLLLVPSLCTIIFTMMEHGMCVH